VADGNFKADHVYYKKAVDDVWLGEGGGMIPNRRDYKEFLETAKELQTVGDRPLMPLTFFTCRYDIESRL